MNDAADRPASGTPSVAAALLDYFEAPGKYQLTLRQPAVLFRSIRDILLLACGRGPADAPQSHRLREAANFFVRAALLYPGADHYAVLGLVAGEEAGDLKERYRLLMRLIHPDFAAGASFAWPEDAAVRVNRAYEVLSSPVLRRAYDDELASLRARRPAAAQPTARRARVAAAHTASPARRRLGRRAAWALGIAALVPAALLLVPTGEQAHLIQRADARRPTPQGPATSPPVATPAAHEALPGAEPVAQIPGSMRAAASGGSLATPDDPVQGVQPAARAAAPRPHELAAAPLARSTVARGEPPAALTAASSIRPPPPSAAAAVEAVVPGPDASSLAVAVAPQATGGRDLGVQPPVAAPPPLAASVATLASGGRLSTTLAVPPRPIPTLNDAQPVLTQMLQVLESGSGEQLLRLLDSEARQRAGAQALSRKYEQLVKDARPIQVADVEFSAEPREGLLLVTGRVRLHAGEPTIGSYGQKLVLRAEFVQRGGKTQLQALSSVPE